ncbi:MAG: T9SS type A sorting domain-containing protein, partial [Chitinophagales bacterium]|nr:T9SS type A sorting domain-containing protein [Chitinophagales bacterium]
DDKIAWYENQLIAAVGVNNSTSINHSILYYPNPITNTLTIQQPTAQTATYTLYNTLGQAVDKGTFDTPTHTIPVSHLAVGMYYLQVNGVSFKVMKQ